MHLAEYMERDIHDGKLPCRSAIERGRVRVCCRVSTGSSIAWDTVVTWALHTLS